MKTYSTIIKLALAVSALACQGADAQVPVPARAASVAAVQRYTDGRLLEHRGDESGALAAFLEAAQGGYPPAQRRLGEIYDSGNGAVERDFSESIRWYQQAREGGEIIPPPVPRYPEFKRTP